MGILPHIETGYYSDLTKVSNIVWQKTDNGMPMWERKEPNKFLLEEAEKERKQRLKKKETFARLKRKRKSKRN